MNLKITRHKYQPIGLDIGSSAVKAVQLRHAGEEFELAAAAAEEHTEAQHDTDKLSGALKKLLKSSDFHGRRVITSLPAQNTFVHHVRVPVSAESDSLEAAVREELSGKLPYPISDAVVRHIVVGDVPGEEPKREVVAVVIRRGILEGYLEALRKAKLDVVGVNIEACALVECFARVFRRAGDADRTVMFIDLGERSTQVVLAQGVRICFARNLFIAGQQLDEAVAEGLGLSREHAHALRKDLARGGQDEVAENELYRVLAGPLEAMTAELTQSLRYHASVFRNQSVERAIFVGGGAHDKRLCQAIAQRLNMPAQVGDPLLRIGRVDGAGLDIGLDRREPQPRWAVAVGLSYGAGMDHAA